MYDYAVFVTEIDWINMEFRCGGLYFTSKFDSGNLARVEKTQREDDDEETTHKGKEGTKV